MLRAKYTVVLKTLLDDERVNPLINKALSTYPMYESTSKEEYIPSVIPTREELNKKILNYYKYREIGFETIGRFLDELEISMNEIMPYYNQLFFSADQDYNIIYNVDYKKTITTNRDGSSSNKTTGSEDVSNTSKVTDNTSTTAEANSYNKNVESSTPQGLLDIGTKGIDSVNYADKVNWGHNTSNDKGTSTGESNSTGSSKSSNSVDSEGTNKMLEDTLETTKGNFGVVSAQDLVAKYREIIINIEQQIINDERISELFMRVY